MKSIAIARQKKREKSFARLNSPAVVDYAANILRSYKPTPFSGEGALVANVRRNRCLAGIPFDVADGSARALAEAALAKIGWSVRPRRSEAGPIVTDTKTCPTCHEEIFYVITAASDRWGYPLRFCSFECARSAKLNRFRSTETTTCAHCGNEFAALSKDRGARADSKYCSQYCYRASIAARQHAPRACENPSCGQTFTPARGQKGEAQRFCSQDCFKAASASTRKAPPRPCQVCGTIFQSNQYGPQALAQKYCSRACYLKATRREPRPCLECGSIFTPAKADRRFCSNRCSALYRVRQRSNTFRCEAA